MSSRNVRDRLVDDWVNVLIEEGACSPSKARAVALKQAAIAEGHGIRLARPALAHDPIADDWHGPQRPHTGDAAAGAAAARKAQRPSEAPGL